MSIRNTKYGVYNTHCNAKINNGKMIARITCSLFVWLRLTHPTPGIESGGRIEVHVLLSMMMMMIILVVRVLYQQP